MEMMSESSPGYKYELINGEVTRNDTDQFQPQEMQRFAALNIDTTPPLQDLLQRLDMSRSEKNSISKTPANLTESRSTISRSIKRSRKKIKNNKTIRSEKRRASVRPKPKSSLERKAKTVI